MHSSKVSAQIIIETLLNFGVDNIVISPGSRNSPLIIESVESNRFKLHSIIDERSAGFVALGLAQQTKKPVALFCTSGSAVLNYAPAFAEAYYMKIPLIAISADRPKELINMADGQTINQNGALQNVVKTSVNLNEIKSEDPLNIRFFYRELVNGLSTLLEEPIGPIHINIPFSEPLYDMVSKPLKFPFPQFNFCFSPSNQLFDEPFIKKIFSVSPKVIFLIGQRSPEKIENEQIIEFCSRNNIPILCETNSNLLDKNFAISIDAFLESLNQEENLAFQPEVLITYKTNIVSKKIKVWLKSNLSKHHIHIGKEHQNLDTYNSLSLQINAPLEKLFNSKIKPANKLYFEKINGKLNWVKKQAKTFKADYSDFKVFEIISKAIPADTCVIFGNSASIRYAQLFEDFYNFESYCNRGTSGIEGSLSTAIGAAYTNPKKEFICILGDTSFFYDSNALLNPRLPQNLKVIVLNNNGGGIFRIIEGPARVNSFEKYIETEHGFNAEHLAKNFNVTYFKASNTENLQISISNLISEKSISILEIFTPKKTNDLTLKSFFKTLRHKD